MCTTTTHYETHISSECSAGGTGQCDGYCVEHNHECTCGCHNDMSLPDTIAEVRDWHDEAEGIVASFDIGTQAEQWFLAVDAMVSIKAENPNREYRVLAGQDRTVVAERY